MGLCQAPLAFIFQAVIFTQWLMICYFLSCSSLTLLSKLAATNFFHRLCLIIVHTTIWNYLVLLYCCFIIICQLLYDIDLFIFWFFLVLFPQHLGMCVPYITNSIHIYWTHWMNKMQFYFILYAEVAVLLCATSFRIWTPKFCTYIIQVQIPTIICKVLWRHWQRLIANTLTTERELYIVHSTCTQLYTTRFI